MIYILFVVLFCVLGWLLTRKMPSKYRYLALTLLLILIITSFMGVYSYRWQRMTQTVSSMAR